MSFNQRVKQILGDLYRPELKFNPPFYPPAPLPPPIHETPRRTVKVKSRKQLRKIKKNNQVVEISGKLLKKSIRQIAKIGVHLCCFHGIEESLLGFLKTHPNLVCSSISLDSDGNGIDIELSALNYLGRKSLAKLFGDMTFVDREAVKLIEMETTGSQHYLSSPVCLDPSNCIPLYMSPNMRVCENCGKPDCKKTCPCKDVRYCSKSCQLAHWKKHKKLCEL
jgi:hypothetical protein